jgi:GT2 family glycosyltransferase
MSNTSLLFSIVIPTYKRHQALIDCLSCLVHYFEHASQSQLGFQIEVIVSDDARDPELKALLLRRYPWCQYLEGPARGPAANRNYGARQASGDWVVFTDDDCLPQPGWIDSYFLFTGEYDVLEGKTSPDGVRTRVDEECPINETGGLLWACNFAIKRDTFLALGGFNEVFPAAAMEDVELNLRINKVKLIRKYVPDAQVNHPWRKRKGRGFAKVYAQSVAAFVVLHPEEAARFSLWSQSKNVLRSLKQNIAHSASTGKFQGLSRQLFLDGYSAYMAWKAVRQCQ